MTLDIETMVRAAEALGQDGGAFRRQLEAILAPSLDPWKGPVGAIYEPKTLIDGEVHYVRVAYMPPPGLEWKERTDA